MTRLLYIDDSKADRSFFAVWANKKSLDYDCTFAGSISEAARALAEKPFDVIVSDYFLPDGTAIDVLNLKTGIPVIVVTSGSDEEQAVGVMRAGAFDYLLKHSSGQSFFDMLVIAVANAVEHRKERESLNMLSQAITLIRESVFICDKQEKIIFVNAAFCAAFGYSEEEIIGKHSSVVWKRPGCEERRVLPRQISGTRIYNVRKDGTVFPVYLSRSIIPAGPGGEETIIAVARDISDFKHAQEEVQESRQRLQQLAESIQEIFWLFDLQEKRMLYVSPAYERIMGRKDSDAFKDREAFLALVDERDKLRMAEVFEQRFAAGFDAEYRILRPSGEIRWLHERTYPIRSSSGEVCRISGIAEDITERKTVERQMARLASFPELSPEAIVEFSLHKELRYLNPEAKNVLPDLEEAGMVHSFFAGIDEILPQLISGEKTAVVREVSLERRWLRQVFHLVREIETIRVYAFDITEEKQLALQAMQHLKLQSIGELAAGIAHEINTPIQYIRDNTKFVRSEFENICVLLEQLRGICDAAKAGQVPAELFAAAEEQWERIDPGYLVENLPKAAEASLKGIDRVAKIVRSMREFSHMGSEDKTLASINHALENTIVVSTNEWKYVADLETHFSSDLPDILCFPDELNQVFLNLILNAADAIREALAAKGEGGKGKITVSTRPSADAVEVRFKDTGAGIPERIKDKVFDPFFTTKAIGKGTGQGLAISYQVVVQRHNGKIWFESEPGQGTEFIVQLPIS